MRQTTAPPVTNTLETLKMMPIACPAYLGQPAAIGAGCAD